MFTISNEISYGTIISIVITVSTFLWYRSGRLWCLYFNLKNKSYEQIKGGSIDRASWKQIFETEINSLTQTLFGSIFAFENAYLRYYLNDIWKESLWTTKNSTTSTIKKKGNKYIRVQESFKISNDEFYITHKFRIMLGWKFAFGGVGLFVISIYWSIKSVFQSKGYIRIREIDDVRTDSALDNI